MRIRTILIAVSAALISAALGVAASGATTQQTQAQVSRASHGMIIARGPRGYRGARGYRGLRGPTGPQGATGSQGPAGTPGTDRVSSFSVNWSSGNWSGHDSASVNIAGIGTLTAVCNPSQQTLTLTPASASVRTSVNVSDFEATQAFNTQPFSQDGSPIPIGSPNQGGALPPNGLIMATFSIQPVNGNGGPGPSPTTLTMSSEYGPSRPPSGYCYLAGQVTQGG
jgi:hypothetical protein